MAACGCRCERKNECSDRSWWPFSSCTTAILAGLLFLFALLYYFFAHSKLPRGAVVANGYECAEIGGKIIQKGGSAVDGAIATAFCESVAMPSTTGLGGGFFMTVHTHRQGNAECLDAREEAPKKATKRMFPNQILSRFGPLAVAVPGQLRGLEAAHKKYGKLSWSELIEPTIKLCEEGVYVTKFFEIDLRENEITIKKNEALRNIFISPKHGEPYKEGEKIKYPTYAKTLRVIADEGADALYTGSLVKDFVKDINGIIDEEDMAHYAPRWTDPVTSTLLKGETMYTSSEPGSGLLLTFIFNVLNGFIDENVNSYKNWQRIIEAFKHAYGLKTWLGDDPYLIREAKENLTSEEFAKATQKKIFDDRTCKKPTYYGAGNFPPPDTGSVNICVLDIYGDSVVLTSSLSRNFGAGIASQSTGIILNSQMGEFSSPCGHGEGCLPPNKANFIEHGKRPLTSMSPTVIVDIDNQMKFLVGATGGPRMITQIALTVLKKLWFNMTLEEAVQHPRFHHQLFPMVLYLEKEFDVKEQALVTAFRQIGHEIEIEECPTYAGVTAIYKDHNNLYAVTDPRRPGSSYYIYT